MKGNTAYIGLSGLAVLSVFVFQFLFSGCQFRKDEFVDFADTKAARDLTFKVIGQGERNLGDGIPYD